METSVPALEWDSEDSTLLQQFLATRAGRRFLPKVAESRPPLLAKGDVNEILIRSGEVRGVETTIQAIMSLAYPAPETKTESSPYPALTDDAAWKDGQRLEEPKPPTQT